MTPELGPCSKRNGNDDIRPLDPFQGFVLAPWGAPSSEDVDHPTSNGEEAVRLAQRGGYGAILMDCHMPGMDGFDAAAAIRRGEQGFAHTPVIAVSADVSAETRARCLSSGMDDFLGKPLRLDEIDRVLRAWLK